MLENQTALISRLKQGDIKAFETIYAFYHQRIYNFCLKLLPSADDALDAVQKVFITVYEQRETLDDSKSLTAYIYSIARYTAYHDFKNLVYRKAAFDQMSSGDNFSETVKDEVLFNELTDVINRIIDQLPAHRKMIFCLSRFYSLSYKAIASKLNISENTVDTQIRRALNFIRTEYSKYFSH